MKYLLIILVTGFMHYSMAALECPNVTNPVPLPALDPLQFSYSIQISIEDLRQTLDGYEFYDHENETVTLYIDKSFGSNHTTHDSKITYDYKYNQTFLVETIGNTTTCTVSELNATLPHQPTLFGVGVENGPLSVTKAFYWNQTTNAAFLGLEVIDGIETEHYNTCLTFEDKDDTLRYDIDVYFSVGNWSMPSGQKTPVLLTLNATYDNGTWRSYTYKFSNYHTSQSHRRWRPQKPGDMICHGRKDAPDFPFGNFSRYALSTQTRGTRSGYNFFFGARTYIDYERKLTMLDIKLPRSSRRVYDFNQGLLYVTNATTGYCNITSIPPLSTPFVVAVVNDTKVRMNSFFDPRKDLNLTYGGMTHYQDVLVHSWISQKPVTVFDPLDKVTNASMSITYYFTVEKFNGFSTLIGLKETIVAQVNSSTVSHVLYSDIYDEKFDFDPLVFDISSCFNSSMLSTVILKFSKDLENEFEKYPSVFERALVAAIAKHSGLEEVRIKFTGSFQTNSSQSSAENDHDSDGVYVWITLLAVPPVQGDSADPAPQVELSTALDNLKKIVNANSFVVSFNGSKVNTMAAFPDYFETQSDLLRPRQPPPPKPSPHGQNGFSSGAVAGLAIGMVVLGLLLGYGLFYCRNGRLRSQYAYSMQN